MTAIPFYRTLLCALLALALVPAAARADDPAPALPVPAADPLMATAHTLAVSRWGTDPCGGQVQVSWNHMGPGINARSQWMSVDAHDPSTYSQCAISYNLDVDWDWPKLCTVVEHELGHLAGHDHVNDPHDVMSPYYVYPSAECSAATQQVAPAPAPVAVAQSPTASSAKATKKAKKAAKRKASAKRRKASARKASTRSKRGSARSKRARGKTHARAATAGVLHVEVY
jgi:Matrixin